MAITIIYDNNHYDSRLKSAWGFSCAIKFKQKTVLFDTGGDGALLLHNMEKLGIDPRQIEVVVLSHIHGDHVGGLSHFLECNSKVTVYMPTSFPKRLKNEVSIVAANIEEVYEARELFNDVFTTGELDSPIIEQALIVNTSKGLVVVMGCAHPGIVKIAKKAKEINTKGIYLMVGGFHMVGVSSYQIEDAVDNLQQLGVKKVAPCHCSGEVARKLFKEYFGDNYIDCGVGKELIIE